MNTVNGNTYHGYTIGKADYTDKTGWVSLEGLDRSKRPYSVNTSSSYKSVAAKVDTFVRTSSENVAVDINNYYTANVKQSNAPYPSNNCYVEDVEGAQAALDKLKAEADSFDYTGMSKGEIFVAVFDRYAEYFGEDFLSIEWQQYYIDRSHINNIENKQMPYTIRDQFYKELPPANDINESYEQHAYFFGYEGMTKDEIKSQAMNEFALSGGTYPAYFEMVYKLKMTGVITPEEAFALNDAVSTAQLIKKEPPISELFYEKYSNLLYANYESMDVEEVFKIWDETLSRKFYSGKNADMYKAADEKARDILAEVTKMLNAVK